MLTVYPENKYVKSIEFRLARIRGNDITDYSDN